MMHSFGHTLKIIHFIGPQFIYDANKAYEYVHNIFYLKELNNNRAKIEKRYKREGKQQTNMAFRREHTNHVTELIKYAHSHIIVSVFIKRVSKCDVHVRQKQTVWERDAEWRETPNDKYNKEIKWKLCILTVVFVSCYMHTHIPTCTFRIFTFSFH